MKISSRIKAILGIAVALAVVAGAGVYWAQSSAAASLKYVTAVAGTGDVTQTYTATGSVTRKNTAEASFEVSGTVSSVKVSVGDKVQAGDTLATLNKASLQLAVLNASTSVAQAEASLYAAKHPTSTSSGSGGSGSTGGVVVNPAILTAATSRVNTAVADEATKCDALIASLTADSSGTTSSSAGTSSPAEESPAAAEPSASATPTETATSLAKVTAAEVSDEDLAACVDARAEVIAANTNLQELIAKLTSSTGSTKKKSSSSSTTVSKSAVAKAKAALLEAQQGLDTANANLAKAKLVAPISGTVGTVGLSVGSSSSSGSITIVGSGNAEITFELPLKTRRQVEVGQAVTVTPAGSTTELTGKITSIATLATSGTSGDTATYTAIALIEDPKSLLPSGSKAAVTMPINAVTGVLRVPASAVTPTGTGTATVQVVTSTSATTAKSTEVKTGAVGGGWVQITSGLDAGAIVVLADNTAEIPSNQTSRRRTTSTSSSSTSSSTAASSAGATPAAAAPTAQPSATATSK